MKKNQNPIARIARRESRCGCGRVATHYAAGPRCDECRKLEENWFSKHTTNGGIKLLKPAMVEPYAVHLPGHRLVS